MSSNFPYDGSEVNTFTSGGSGGGSFVSTGGGGGVVTGGGGGGCCFENGIGGGEIGSNEEAFEVVLLGDTKTLVELRFLWLCED